MVITYLVKYSHLAIEEEEYLTVIAPISGVLVGIIIKGLDKQLKRSKRFQKWSSARNLEIEMKIKDPTLKLLQRYKINLAARKFVFIYRTIFDRYEIRVLFSSLYLIVRGILVIRSVLLLVAIGRYYFKSRKNLFEIAFNTLSWIVYCKERKVVVSLTFLLISSLTTAIWCKFQAAQKFFVIWTLISIFNLSGHIDIYTSPVFRPANIGAFGVPLMERPIQRLKPMTELQNRMVSLPGKEDEFVLSFPLLNEMPKGSSKDAEKEIHKIMNSSRLGEEEIPIKKREGLQKGEVNRTNSTLKPKTRMNSLQKLNSTADIMLPLTVENEMKNIPNSTRIKEDNVR